MLIRKQFLIPTWANEKVKAIAEYCGISECEVVRVCIFQSLNEIDFPKLSHKAIDELESTARKESEEA
jgi:hypothetical protein